MSEILESVKRFRAEILAGERSAASALVTAYGQVWTRLQAELKAVLEEIAAERKKRRISRTELRRRERLQSLIRQVETVIGDFARNVEATVRAQQSAAIEAAAKHTRQLALEMDTPPSIATTWNRLPSEAVTDLVGTLQDGSPLRTLLDELGTQAAQSVEKELITGLAIGKNPRVIAQAIRKEVGVSLVRALRISRTETMRSYRTASQRTYQANSDVVRGWVWIATLSPRTCAACLAMHGTFHSLDEPFGSHVNCFPAGTVVQSPPLEASTSRWYKGEIIDVETISGNFFSVTPNHPILTSEGWVAAGLLHEGGNVVRALDTQAILRTVNPNYNNVPALIEDIAEAFGRKSGVSVVTVPTSSEDFHGDGVGSEVCVVRAYGLLRNAFDTSIFQPLLEEQFMSGRAELDSLTGDGAATFFFKGHNSAAYSIMRGANQSRILFGGALGCKETIGFDPSSYGNMMLEQDTSHYITRHAKEFPDFFFGMPRQIQFNHTSFVETIVPSVVSDRNSVFQENAQDHFFGDTIGAREFLSRFANLIAADKIVKIRRRPFKGHIYNLQSSEGWYIANNIIAHNCRCTVAPQTRSAADLGIQSGADWLEKQSEARQDAVLGSRAAGEALRKKEVDLQDFVKKRNDPRWGVSRTADSLKGALERAQNRK